ncbi:MAG: hypothetical protein D6724_01135 [Armatimonadetes bacterium]|nr:MAG: hypothetical protein D6724_01135 [Armatimonadota bacterium]
MKKPPAKLLIALAVLFVVQAFVSQSLLFPTWKKNYSTGELRIDRGLNADQLLASLAGLREMVAGILWVQTDQYFDTGQFDAVLPLIRLVTWLNPRQVEVYSTGAWHIAYNFTDEQNRSDRRYIPIALRLLEEGVQNNPNTYEMYFEVGWLYYHKIDDDYWQAVHWFEQSVEKKDILPARKGILFKAYEKNGQLDDSVSWLWKLQQEAEEQYARDGDNLSRVRRDTNERNLNNQLIRMTQRGVFGRRAGVYDQWPYDTHNPVDLNFTFSIRVIEPKVLRVTGTWGIPTTGARVRMQLFDEDYDLKWEPAPDLNFDRDKDRTFMQDELYTQNGRFDRKIDMSRNPNMYPFRAEKYKVVFSYNPRSAPAHIQDKIGWDGEGMTDQRYLKVSERYKNTDGKPGVRILYAEVELTRDQILMRGEYANGYVYNSPGYVPVEGTAGPEVVIPRSLRK